ncbi:MULTISPECIES: hypothetical protein [unclassified Novosphingobium]|uniref:hypothetical protein n=1 Tax=unclassified Novosphingobium TaxID=2644732 RepID=UPI0006C881E0|nr:MULTISPECIES: hypothetical protein [unclassified Novosphingobium]KPH58731.1 hypothetical protein ADT71_25810 [Novosphingobium sp. ST904]MPS70694.1 hypothetical protein [Novosphingobium sp.]TCM42231.1 hypothetical protein EDF59_102194 [Novosphingobium sp. ST904]
MLRIFKRILLLVGLLVVLVGGVHLYAGWRLHGALVEAGLSDRVASCMTRRMVKRLSLPQLVRLQNLQGDKPTIGAWIRAVELVDDRKVILVTTSSAALCKTGLAR